MARQRQWRRLGGDHRAGGVDQGAYGANFVRGRGELAISLIGSARRDGGAVAPKQGLLVTEGRAMKVHMAEGNRELERQREQRQIRTQPRM